MRSIETIIWDLDGTLLDSIGVYADVLGEVLPNHGLAVPSLDVLVHNYHAKLGESIGSAIGLTGEQLDRIEADFLLAQEKYYEVVEHHLFADALELARRAHESGVSFQAIVTSRDHAGRNSASPRHIVANSSLNSLISDIICGDDTAFQKPMPELVERFITSGQLVPETTLVIGDQFKDGLLAINLGARGILVNRHGGQLPHLEKLGKDYARSITIVPTLAEVEL